MQRVVIIGGGFGGLDAARALAGAPVRVTLLDRHNYHLFQPLLYQVATASLSPGDIASPIRWILRHQQNVRVLLADARTIDVLPRRVVLGRRTGRRLRAAIVRLPDGRDRRGTRYFGHPEWATRAPGLKTLDDALEIRRRVLLAFEAAEREPIGGQRRLLTFVIVGGGPTGVELAGALAEIARRSAAPGFPRHPPGVGAHRPSRRQSASCSARFPSRCATRRDESLTRLGVEVLTGSLVTAVDAEGVTWRAPASADARECGTPRGADRAVGGGRRGVAAGGVAWRPARSRRPRHAEPTLAVPGRPEIFVVGDICALQQDGKPLPGVAQVAKQEGAHAARNILRAIRRTARAVSLPRLRQHGDHRPRLGGGGHRAARRPRASSPG